MKKIKINYLTLYFLLIAFFCGYIKNALIVFFIVCFHELGHILISILLKHKIISIELFPFGGYTKIDSLYNDSFLNSLLISIMGIVFQLILFLFIHEKNFIYLNKMIILFNLLPIIPLDGAKILFEIYAYFLPFKNCIIIYYITSFIFIIIYIIFNYKYNLNNYMIICLFIYKTILIVKNKKLIYEKFLLEKMFYDINYKKIKNENLSINKYIKNTKYYYNVNGKIYEDKVILQNMYKKCKVY